MKYHIKKDGTPGVCHAQQGNCPFGGSSHHFEAQESAQEYMDSYMASKAHLGREIFVESFTTDATDLSIMSKPSSTHASILGERDSLEELLMKNGASEQKLTKRQIGKITRAIRKIDGIKEKKQVEEKLDNLESNLDNDWIEINYGDRETAQKLINLGAPDSILTKFKSGSNHSCAVAYEEDFDNVLQSADLSNVETDIVESRDLAERYFPEAYKKTESEVEERMSEGYQVDEWDDYHGLYYQRTYEYSEETEEECFVETLEKNLPHSSDYFSGMKRFITDERLVSWTGRNGRKIVLFEY